MNFLLEYLTHWFDGRWSSKLSDFIKPSNDTRKFSSRKIRHYKLLGVWYLLRSFIALALRKEILPFVLMQLKKNGRKNENWKLYPCSFFKIFHLGFYHKGFNDFNWNISRKLLLFLSLKKFFCLVSSANIWFGKSFRRKFLSEN